MIKESEFLAEYRDKRGMVGIELAEYAECEIDDESSAVLRLARLLVSVHNEFEDCARVIG